MMNHCKVPAVWRTGHPGFPGLFPLLLLLLIALSEGTDSTRGSLDQSPASLCGKLAKEGWRALVRVALPDVDVDRVSFSAIFVKVASKLRFLVKIGTDLTRRLASILRKYQKIVSPAFVENCG